MYGRKNIKLDKIMLFKKQNICVFSCCLAVPYVSVDMQSVRSVNLCATVIFSDLRCATFRMHFVFAPTAAWNAD